jgi:hypothetical protein
MLAVARFEFLMMNYTMYLAGGQAETLDVMDEFENILFTLDNDIKKVKKEIGILLHHDAISATSSESNVQDYYNVIQTQSAYMLNMQQKIAD